MPSSATTTTTAPTPATPARPRTTSRPARTTTKAPSLPTLSCPPPQSHADSSLKTRKKKSKWDTLTRLHVAGRPVPPTTEVSVRRRTEREAEIQARFQRRLLETPIAPLVEAPRPPAPQPLRRAVGKRDLKTASPPAPKTLRRIAGDRNLYLGARERRLNPDA